MSKKIDSRAADIVDEIFAQTIALHEIVRRADVAPILEAADAIVGSLASGGKLLVFGNGGSAADAQHVAAELVGKFERARAALPAISLTTDTSIVTSVANDDCYERVFVRQIEGIARPGDVALGITTSGASPSVVDALKAAKARGVRTIALTGRDGGEAGRAADIHVNVPAASTARVQEVHRTLLHAICGLVEEALA